MDIADTVNECAARTAGTDPSRSASHESVFAASGLLMMIGASEHVLEKPPLRLTEAVPRLTQTPRIKTLDCWAHAYGIDWYGWTELEGLYRVRHCFGHGDGTLLGRHADPIVRFAHAVGSGQIKDRAGVPTDDYLGVTGDRIVLSLDAVTRVRTLLGDLLDHAGVR